MRAPRSTGDAGRIMERARAALRISPDLIDSAGHYERGNVQLVCKFANAWKGAQQDGEFRRLLELLRSGPQMPAEG